MLINCLSIYLGFLATWLLLHLSENKEGSPTKGLSEGESSVENKQFQGSFQDNAGQFSINCHIVNSQNKFIQS